MKLIVSGKTKDFTPELEEKFNARISKLGKFIERRGEREAWPAWLRHMVEHERQSIRRHPSAQSGADPEVSGSRP